MKVLNFNDLSIDQAKLLNEVSLEIRTAFNNFITTLSIQHENSLVWHLSSIASRNTYQSNMFIWCCQLALVKKVIEEGESLDLVITDSMGMKKVLDNFFNGHATKIPVRYSISVSVRLNKIFRPLVKLGSSVLNMIRLYYYSRTIKQAKEYSFPKPITLLDCFVLKSSFLNESNSFADRYYPGILDYLSEDEKNCTYYLPTLEGIDNYRTIFKKIRNEENNFLIKEDYLHVCDFLIALLGVFTTIRLAFKIKSKAAQFLNFNMLPLVHEESRTSFTHWSSIAAILNYRFVRRMAERKVPLRLVVDWNENQVIDRGLIKGIHDFYPEIMIVGYQGYIVSSQLNIYIHPTSYENSMGVIPDQVAVMGSGLVNGAKEFCPELSVVIAPAARFRKIWDDNSTSEVTWGKNNIFLPLPMLKDDCKIILEIVATSIKIARINEVSVFIKQHPTQDQDEIKRIFKGHWPDIFKFITGEFQDILKKINLVIGNTSSACVESIAKGVPVIIIGNPSGLTQNPIPTSINEDIWTLCNTAQELADAIKFYLSRPPEKIREHLRIGNEIRLKYFEPVTREGVRKFLQLPL